MADIIITDELLMAFVDGELNFLERLRIARALTKDATLRARLRIFERTGRVLGHAYETSPRSIPAILTHGPRSDPYNQANWLDSMRALLTPARGWALSALVLVIGFSAAMIWPMIAPRPGSQPLIYATSGRLEAGGALLNALKTAPSRGFQPEGSAEAAAIIQSFRDAEGSFCREYASGAAGGRGVACLKENGGWVIVVHSASSSNSGSGANFSTAGTAQDQLIDGYVHRIMQGDALTPEAELASIKAGWRRL